MPIRKAKKVASPTGRPSKKRAAIKKLDRGDVSGAFRGGKRPAKPKVKPKVKSRPRTLRDLQMDRIIAGKSPKK
jgi:hypothetical protein